MLTIVTSFSLTTCVAWAEKGNAKLIVTDQLDDDLRGQIEALLNEDTEIKGVLVSTGNVFLKAAVARKILDSFGRKDVPVYIGTASDLSKSDATKFAHEITKYGAPQLSAKEREALATMAGRNGRGVAQLARAMQTWTAPVDVIFATSPVDFNAAVDIDFVQAKAVIGDMDAMGFWTDTDRFPFNREANVPAVDKLLEYYEAGLGRRFRHVPTYVVRNMKGTENGYVINGSAIHKRILSAMMADPTLRDALQFGLEYRLSWMSKATGQFGIGFSQLDDWVPDTYRHVTDPSPFYLADFIPVLLSNMTADELSKVHSTTKTVSTLAAEGKIKIPTTTDGTSRSFTEIQSFDVTTALERHADKLESWVNLKHPTQNLAIDPVAAQIIPTLKDRTSLAELINVSGPKTALFLTYKNSPDDSLSLLLLLAFRFGRESLANGAIITEGFAAVEQARYLKALLADFGINNIPVMVGHTYTKDEVRAIPNFKGEQFLHDSGQNLRAFDTYLRNSQLLSTASAQLGTIIRKRIQEGFNLDAIILAEGVDYLKELSFNKTPALLQGKNYVMGGGRLDKGAFVWTRNWLRDKNEVISGLSLAASHGIETDIYSSDQYSGALAAVINNEVVGGTAANTVHTLSDHSKIRPVGAVLEHWINWSRGFDYIRNNVPNKEPFDPNSTMSVINCGTNALYMVEDWLRSNLDPTYRTDGTPKELTSMTGVTTSPSKGIVNWLVRDQVNQNEEGLAKLVEIAVKQLVSFVEASALSQSVQRGGIFSAESQRALDKLQASTNGDQCEGELE